MAKRFDPSDKNWEVLLAENGRLYLRADGKQTFHSFMSLPGSIMSEEASKIVLSQDGGSEKISLTHLELSNMLKIVFEILKSEETENE